MGTGMAIPWRLADSVELAGGSLVEDMQLGIDLALQGHLPLFCPEARVTSGLPPARSGVREPTHPLGPRPLCARPRPRFPRLLAAAVARRSWPLLAMALDLSIPPLTLLVALWLGAAILAGAAWWLGASWLPLALLTGGGAALVAAIGVGWAVFCRRQVSLWAFTAVPLYMFINCQFTPGSFSVVSAIGCEPSARQRSLTILSARLRERGTQVPPLSLWERGRG